MPSKINVSTFPYSEDTADTPYTDGLLDSYPGSATYMPPLGPHSSTPQSIHKLDGTVAPNYIGSTSMIFATKIWNLHDGGSC